MAAVTVPADVRSPTWTWWREASASVADLGVLVPIAVALIVGNGLSATAVLLPAGLTYLAAAWLYRVPVAVQPLKAFGAVAIAAGAGVETIAAGALLMGVVFLALGGTGVLDRLARVFPVAVTRGVQLAVGLTFARIAWGLVTDPPAAFEATLAPALALAVMVGLTVVLLRWPGRLVLVVVAAGMVVAAVVTRGAGAPVWGPSAVALPHIDLATLAAAATLLVLPQVPLTLTNSCLAPADAARAYFGPRAAAVTPSRLALSLGAANVLVGAVGGMPLCHGAGGMSAHHSFGGRTGRTPALIGGALVVGAVAGGAGLATLLSGFPLPLLAALLVVAGLTHVLLLRDLRGATSWSIAVGVGVLGFATNLGWAVLAGLVAHVAVARLRRGER
ncbi:MAG TPA: molybdate transporter family protein [Actinotalea sp.]|nr:molybdate transporter family protein [Actinotalea sp.]